MEMSIFNVTTAGAYNNDWVPKKKEEPGGKDISNLNINWRVFFEKKKKEEVFYFWFSMVILL